VPERNLGLAWGMPPRVRSPGVGCGSWGCAEEGRSFSFFGNKAVGCGWWGVLPRGVGFRFLGIRPGGFYPWVRSSGVGCGCVAEGCGFWFFRNKALRVGSGWWGLPRDVGFRFSG
jgi:hypothetical protein